MDDNNVLPEFPQRVSDGVKLDDVYFSPDALIKACKRIKPKLTPGPDGYPPFLIKQIISSAFNREIFVNRLIEQNVD